MVEPDPVRTGCKQCDGGGRETNLFLLTDLSDEEALAPVGTLSDKYFKALNAPALVKTARQDSVIIFI